MASMFTRHCLSNYNDRHLSLIIDRRKSSANVQRPPIKLDALCIEFEYIVFANWTIKVFSRLSCLFHFQFGSSRAVHFWKIVFSVPRSHVHHSQCSSSSDVQRPEHWNSRAFSSCVSSEFRYVSRAQQPVMNVEAVAYSAQAINSRHAHTFLHLFADLSHSLNAHTLVRLCVCVSYEQQQSQSQPMFENGRFIKLENKV